MMNHLLQSHLKPIARDYQRWRLWRALTKCWAALGLIGLGFILIHRLAGWSSPWTLPSSLAAAALAAATTVYRARNTPVDDRALARRIEQDNPQLHALLLTAVEQQPDPATGGLHYLQERVIAEALEHHRRCPWDERLPQKLFAARCAHGLALGLLVIVLAGLRTTPTAGRGPLATRSNGVAITPGDTSLERGSGLVVLARFAGKLPLEPALVVKPLNQPEFRLPLAKNLEDPVFGAAVPEVSSDLTYRVEFARNRTRDFKVVVFDYPCLEHADATVVYPRYTGLPAKTIQDTRRVTAVEGSALDYSFFLNKPVASAKLVAKDHGALTLAGDTNNATVYHARFTLDQSRRYELVLVDDAGRTNKVPPEFVLEALKNRPPEIKLAFPRGDQRVSPLEEIAFEAEASDDFGLRAYGLAYAIAGQAPKVLPLGQNSGAHEKRQFKYLLPLESLAAQPDQLLSYYLWADDLGPDGEVRRTTSDMFFAEIRPFDEIFREGQSPGGGMESAGGGGDSPTQKLAELQKQIISATWNLKCRETAAKPSAPYKKDAAVVLQSQRQALDQVRTMKEKAQDPRLKGFAETAEQEMKKAATQLDEAAGRNSLKPLPQALTYELSAYQALLRLQTREYQVARSRNQRGGGGGASQRQIDQLDLKQADNRYETQRQAAPAQNREQHEQLQVLSRLKELAQRQQDLNERLKEMQTALQEARTDQERADIRRRLKRLREEQQQMLADVDELRQRMERPENQSRMAEARQQLEQTRSEIQRAGQALDQQAIPQALASGTRAQRGLQQLQDEFRKQSSSQFSENMRQMRNDARQLAQKQDQIAQKLEDLGAPKQKTLSDSAERRDLANQLTQQKSGLTNLFNEMSQVSEQSETAEPLLSKQLYDLLRQTGQGALNQSLDLSSELVRRGFLPQAGPFEQRARQNINELKRGVERAAESVLGDEAEALRLAKRELEDLRQQLEKELAQAGSGAAQGTNAAAAGPLPAPTPSSGSNPEARQNQPPTDPRGAGQNQAGQRPTQQAGARSAPGQPGGQGERRGAGQGGASGSQPQPSASASAAPGGTSAAAAGGRGANRAGGQRNSSRPARGGALFNRNAGADSGDAGGGGGGAFYGGPLTGDQFVDWSDRLRDVEEMLDAPDLRTEVARIRDRARAVRQDYKRSGRKPDWAVVRTQIAAPLAEVRSRIGEELARHESKDALVPIDRDPVPARFSERVRRYYEQLGKSD